MNAVWVVVVHVITQQYSNWNVIVHREEVERDDDLAVVLEEGQPTLGWITPAPNSPGMPGHASSGYDEAELLKFSVDLGGSPVRVLLRQASDQNTNLIGDLWPAPLPPGSPTPVTLKTCAAPADNSPGLHNDEHIGPA